MLGLEACAWLPSVRAEEALNSTPPRTIRAESTKRSPKYTRRSFIGHHSTRKCGLQTSEPTHRQSLGEIHKRRSFGGTSHTEESWVSALCEIGRASCRERV